MSINVTIKLSAGPPGPPGAVSREEFARGYPNACLLASKVGKEVGETDTVKGF